MHRLPYTPYPVQEEAMYAWAACEQGVLLSAPTGTGKTLVAEAAVYEGLRTGRGVYYSTPLIALTDQKFLELQDTVQRWGFERDCVGRVTGKRTVNTPAAKMRCAERRPGSSASTEKSAGTRPKFCAARICSPKDSARRCSIGLRRWISPSGQGIGCAHFWRGASAFTTPACCRAIGGW